jgi:DNA-binding NarL/FixJ family response regulator
MMDRIKVLVADDQLLVREGIVSLLKLRKEIEVCAVAEDGRDAVHKTLECSPDVVLMDIRMPVMDGISAVQTLFKQGYPGKVIMLTTFDDEEYILKSLQAGALGYLMKDLPPEDLVRAIQQAYNGTFQVAPAVMSRLMDRVGRSGTAAREDENSVVRELAGNLSSREKEILSLIAGGASNREIADELGLSEGTVKNYVSGILNALGLRDRTQAALTAIKLGLNRD